MIKKMNNEDIVKKWGPVLESSGFLREEIEKVAVYCHYHSLVESESISVPGLPEFKAPAYFPSTLMISISVMKKIKDLSKVKLTPHPNYAEEIIVKEEGGVRVEREFRSVNAYGFTVSIPRSDLKNTGDVDTIQKYENEIINGIAEEINKVIDAGHTITLFLAVSDIRLITQPMADTFDGARILAASRYFINDLTLEDTTIKGVTIHDL
jgi:hypothetical protein